MLINANKAIRVAAHVFMALKIAVLASGCITTKTGGGPLSMHEAMGTYGRRLDSLSAEEKSLFDEIARKEKGTYPFARFKVAGSPDPQKHRCQREPVVKCVHVWVLHSHGEVRQRRRRLFLVLHSRAPVCSWVPTRPSGVARRRSHIRGRFRSADR